MRRLSTTIDFRRRRDTTHSEGGGRSGPCAFPTTGNLSASYTSIRRLSTLDAFPCEVICWPTDGVVEETYPSPESKIWLAIESAKAAKRLTVAEDGIGEDLTYNLLAWRDDLLTAVCQLDHRLMSEPPTDRLGRVREVAILCRTGYRATALTMVAEGYCAPDPRDVDLSVPLADQFVSNDSVRECLTITHLEDGQTMILAVPYTYGVPRKVEFDLPMTYPKKETTNPFLLKLHDVLSIRSAPPPVDDETWRDVIANDISDIGFHVHHSIDLPDFY